MDIITNLGWFIVGVVCIAAVLLPFWDNREKETVCQQCGKDIPRGLSGKDCPRCRRLG